MLLRLSLASVLVAILVLTSFACSRKTVYRGKEGEITVEKKGKGGKVTVETKEGKAEIETGKKLPKDWPADMPMYPGAKITSSGSIKGQQGAATLSVVVETPDEAEQIKEFYEKSLPEKGWNITQSYITSQDKEQGVMISTSKGEQTGIITVQKKSGEKAEISIQVITGR